MPAFQDLTGQRFERLLITSRDTSKPGKTYWNYLCDCGNTGSTQPNHLKSGGVKSCGCLRLEPSKWGKTHGHRMAISGRITPTYKCWTSMKQRCTNPHNDRYPRYGGRGITFDPRWLSFENFLADMGERPKGLTLDRIRVNENYGPNNCKWSTGEEQANNKVGQKRYLVDGEMRTCAQIQRHLAITRPRARKLVATLIAHIKDPK